MPNAESAVRHSTFDTRHSAATGQLAVVAKNVLDVRAEPESSSEMVTQAILGQAAWIEGGQDDWFYVRTWDNYRGWARSKWIVSRTYRMPYASGHAVAVVKALFTDILAGPDRSADIITKAVVTTELEVLRPGDEWVTVILPDGREGHVPHSDTRLVDRSASQVIFPPTGEKLVRTARRFIGVPYLWGGTTPFGLDCSGFVQLIYHVHGVTLPRDAHMQAADERAVPVGREGLRAGDLIFFAGGQDRERITHVGMAIGGAEFIHSAGGAGVTVSSLDEPHYRDIYRRAGRIRCETWEAGCPAEG